MNQEGRILAVDYGQRRVGIAISDPTGTLARPLTVLKRRAGKRPPVGRIVELIAENGVRHVVFGLPLDLAGKETDWTREVRDVARRVSERSGCPVSFVDERFTSVMAERMVRSVGLPRGERERKERIDAAAASVILQAWLDRAPAQNAGA